MSFRYRTSFTAWGIAVDGRAGLAAAPVGKRSALMRVLLTLVRAADLPPASFQRPFSRIGLQSRSDGRQFQLTSIEWYACREKENEASVY